MKNISIIIPHYNSWDLLPELLKTIPNYEMFEVIIVDDHSQENEEHFSKLKKQFPYVHFYVNDENKKGAGAARNKGLKIATGQWLLFADADDIFLPDFESVLEPYLISDYDLVFFTPTSFFENKTSDSLRHQTFERYINEYLESEDILKEHTLRYNFSPPWSKLIRRSIIEDNEIWFDETKVANDVMFSAKAGKHADKITATKDKIYAVRQTSGSITSVVSEENFRIRFNVWVNMVNYMQENINANDMERMNISAIPQLLQVFENKLGWRNVRYVMKKAKQNNIPLFDKRIFNPKFLVSSIMKQKKLIDSNQRTVIKK